MKAGIPKKHKPQCITKPEWDHLLATYKPLRRLLSSKDAKVKSKYYGRAVGQLACLFIRIVVQECTALQNVLHSIKCSETVGPINKALLTLNPDWFSNDLVVVDNLIKREKLQEGDMLPMKYDDIVFVVSLTDVSELIYYCRKLNIAEASIGTLDFPRLTDDKLSKDDPVLTDYLHEAAKMIMLNELIATLHVYATEIFSGDEKRQTLEHIAKYKGLLHVKKTTGEWKRLSSLVIGEQPPITVSVASVHVSSSRNHNNNVRSEQEDDGSIPSTAREATTPQQGATSNHNQNTSITSQVLSSSQSTIMLGTPIQNVDNDVESGSGDERPLKRTKLLEEKDGRKSVLLDNKCYKFMQDLMCDYNKGPDYSDLIYDALQLFERQSNAIAAVPTVTPHKEYSSYEEEDDDDFECDNESDMSIVSKN